MKDVMRMEYKALSPGLSQEILTVKAKALDLYNYLEIFAPSREISLARTKIEEAVMWATKHITA